MSLSCVLLLKIQLKAWPFLLQFITETFASFTFQRCFMEQIIWSCNMSSRMTYGESCCLMITVFAELIVQILQNAAAAREKTWEALKAVDSDPALVLVVSSPCQCYFGQVSWPCASLLSLCPSTMSPRCQHIFSGSTLIKQQRVCS